MSQYADCEIWPDWVHMLFRKISSVSMQTLPHVTDAVIGAAFPSATRATAVEGLRRSSRLERYSLPLMTSWMDYNTNKSLKLDATRNGIEPGSFVGWQRGAVCHQIAPCVRAFHSTPNGDSTVIASFVFDFIVLCTAVDQSPILMWQWKNKKWNARDKLHFPFAVLVLIE